MDFKDGEKLSNMLRSVNQGALKYFGKHRRTEALGEVDVDTKAFDAEYVFGRAAATLEEAIAKPLADAKALRDNVRAQRASANWFILKLVWPALPFYLLSLVLSSVHIFCVDGPLVAFAMPVLQNSIAKLDPNATSPDDPRHQDVVWEEAWACLMLLVVGFAFGVPISLIASSLSRLAKRKLRNPLRTHIMRTIVRQDTEVHWLSNEHQLTLI